MTRWARWPQLEAAARVTVSHRPTTADAADRRSSRRRIAPAAAVLLLPIVLGGCSNFGGGATNSGVGGTISTSAQCQQLHNALSNLAGLSHTEWNSLVSDLPPATRDALLADGVPGDQKASAAYANLVSSPEWSHC